VAGGLRPAAEAHFVRRVRMAEREPRKVFLPVEASDLIVTVGGKHRPWLSRFVGAILAPIFRWRHREGADQRRRRDRTA
jgi:hypothetical protein